jgi:ATP-binding cassette subfamily C protein CydD
MSAADSRADRRFLAALGREGHAPAGALFALTGISAVGAGGFALALAFVLTGPGRILALMGLITSLAVGAAADWAAARLTARHAARSAALLRRRVLVALLGRQRGEAKGIGEAIAAAVDEVDAAEGYFSRYAPAAREARIAPLLIAGLVALASPIAAGVLLMTLIPFAAVMALAGGAASAEADRQFMALSRLSGYFVDRVRALPVILAFQAEAKETAQVGAAAEEVSARTLSVLRIAFISSAGLEFFAALAVALTAVYCGFSLLGLLPFKVPETLDFRRAFIALALAPELYAPLRRLAAAYHEKQLGEAAAARLRPLLEASPAPDPPPKTFAAAEPCAPDVRLADLALTLGGTRLGPLNAHAPAGTLTAIIGPTGTGKSTLLAAILGLTPASGGQVEIAGRPLATGALANAAWAGQAPVFLPGTLLENLMAAGPEVTPAEALTMAERVGLAGALAARAGGANTVLDERGSGLSGGERRRLALARALLKPSPLLLLDEPTADLDAASEGEMIALIRGLTPARTVIIATHSQALIDVADHVVSLA